MTQNKRKGGFTFDLGEADSLNGTDDDQPATESTRQSKTFVIEEDVPESVPESIVANERLPEVTQFSLFKLEALPLKGLKVFFYSALALVVVLSGFELVRAFNYALSIHWVLASVFSVLLGWVALLGLRLVYRYLKDTENLSKQVAMQDKAERLLEGNDFGQAKSFINELRGFYKNKPQEAHFERSIQVMPDYSNDKETINHLDEIFLKPLDKEATRRVSTYAVQSGVGVAISPWASLDMLLSLWRSMKMIDDVAQVYGVRPSLPNRLRLFRRVVNQLLFVGATELIAENALAEFGFQGITTSLSARAGQGIGAGFYTAKIGLAAMKVTRPIAFTSANKPKMSSLTGEMLNKVKSIFIKVS
ncbi:TIGR01620 family protein [Marinospirillum insulare]|uniref:TIGR01620 family protein n=1 Tax=Marinospirillum insulare TaxID=217169 RepID=A0ABQ5ZWH5_9GAMM|nr:TIGR01620 family protein [Marinospirillum insulare]GLR63821.1 hypothetical protein GCM10007878_12570 [Marinospirillum insulare]